MRTFGPTEPVMNWLLTTIPSVPTDETPLVTRATPCVLFESVTVNPVGVPSLLRPKNVGLISDKNVEEDENIEESDMFREDDNFKAYNY